MTFAENRMFRARCARGYWTGERAASAILVIFQPDVSLDDVAVPITLSHIPLWWGGAPSLSLLQAANSLRRAWGRGAHTVQYYSQKQQLSLQTLSHVVVSSPRRSSGANTQLIRPCRLHTTSPPLAPPRQRDTQNLYLYLRRSFHGL